MTTALFLLDMAFNGLMLTLALRLDGKRIFPGKVIAGAAMGACVAGWARTSGLSRPLGMLLWLPTAMLMMTIAGARQGKRRTLHSGLLLLCAAGLLGGIVQALLGATGSFAAAYALGCLVAVTIGTSAIRARQSARSVMRARVTMAYRGTEATFDAIIDSGNTLRDYLMHLPVIVLPEKEAKTRLKLESAPLRPIFADTAGGRQMMDCFVPEKVIIQYGKEKHLARAAAALSPGMGSGAPALIPAALVSGNEG